jgi:eukaryotic-like serine/threonine-protein kinase
MRGRDGGDERPEAASDAPAPNGGLGGSACAGVGADEGTHSARADRDPQRYELLWPHAKGGLGQIFVAEDRELHRRVALKEIRPDHAQNPISHQRFVVEAEITGSLEHPGIVPVYGLGTHKDGRPFYAMRFIKGDDLLTAIHRFHAAAAPDFKGLEFRWLLRRFIDVCNTIAYAHSRGVLHRDLKPTNIMLGQFGETLVLDWGVAKPIGNGDDNTISDSSRERFAEAALRPSGKSGSVTLAGQAVGTPAYMSPEQAAGRLDAIGPASDVYSLGATLYVLLTNEPPFRGDSDEVIEAVQSGRFPAPRELKPRVPRALEAICRRAMALQPGQRYESALALAGDIERWLADEPVYAWNAPWFERTRSWVRHHHVLVAGCAAALGVALVALGLAVPALSLAWRNEARARRKEEHQHRLAAEKAIEAEIERKRAVQHLAEATRQRTLAEHQGAVARQEKDRAESTLRFLVEAFRKPDPLADGASLKVVDLLRQAVHDLEGSLADQPLMKATLLNAIGQTYVGLGMTQDALAVFQRALRIRNENLGDDHSATVDSMHGLAQAYQDAGRFDKAIPLLERTLARRKSFLGDDHADTIESMNDLGVAYWEEGQPAKAIPLLEAVLAKTESTLGKDHADTLTIRDNLAVAYGAAGRHDDAIRLHEKTLADLTAKFGALHVTSLISASNLARAIADAGRHSEAIRLYEEILPKLRSKLGDDHPTVLTVSYGLAGAYEGAGQHTQAIRLHGSTLGQRRAGLGPDHPDSLASTFAVAAAYMAANQPERGIPLAREFLERAEKLRDRLPRRVTIRIQAARQLLAEMNAQAGQSARSTPARPSTRGVP